jgi:hypothetical protein
MTTTDYKRINEDFLDDQQLDVQTDRSDLRMDYHFDGTFGYQHLFLFIINKDMSTLPDDEYIARLQAFFDELHEQFNRCLYIRAYDNFRVVNTVSYYYNNEKFEDTVSGLQFFAESRDVFSRAKQNSWFNTTISIDCKDTVTGIIHLIPYLYRALNSAVAVAFGKDVPHSFRYQTRFNEERYSYPGSLQLSSKEEKKRWEALRTMTADWHCLSSLLDSVLAFHPTNKKRDIKKYAQEICKLYNYKYGNSWILTNKDRYGLISTKEVTL